MIDSRSIFFIKILTQWWHFVRLPRPELIAANRKRNKQTHSPQKIKEKRNGSVGRYSLEERTFGGSPADVCMLGTSITPLAVTVLTLYCSTLHEPTFSILEAAKWESLMFTFPWDYRKTTSVSVRSQSCDNNARWMLLHITRSVKIISLNYQNNYVGRLIWLLESQFSQFLRHCSSCFVHNYFDDAKYFQI